jgi:hypothetical protein
MHFLQRRPSGDHDAPIARAGRIAAIATLLIAAFWLGADGAAARGLGFGGGGFGGFHGVGHSRYRATSPGAGSSYRRSAAPQHWNYYRSRRGSHVAPPHHTAASPRHWHQARQYRHIGTHGGHQMGTRGSSQVAHKTGTNSGTQPNKSYPVPATNRGNTQIATNPSSTGGKTTAVHGDVSLGSVVLKQYPTKPVITSSGTTPSRQPPGSGQPVPRPSPTASNYRPPVVVSPPPHRGHPWRPPVLSMPYPMGGPVLSSLPPTDGGTAPPPPPVTPTIRSNIPGGGGAAPPPANVATNSNNFVPDEILVRFTGSIAPDTIATFTRDQRLALLDTHPLPLINTVFYQFRITDGRAVPVVLAGLQGDARIAASQPNYLYDMQQTAPQTAPDLEQYAVEKLHLTQAHDLATGNGVLIAVIDTAIDAGHPDLRDSIVGQYDAVKTPIVPLEHGTAMTGAIVAHGRLEGVAPGAHILAVRAFDAASAGGRSTSTRLLDSLQWTSTSQARIINMSFAGPADPGLQAMILALHRKGVVLVAAAGNNGPQAPPAYPAAYPGVIAVTATDIDDHLLSLANRGSYVAVAAPGVDVMAALPEGKYNFSTGTSIACAHVSGLAALMLQRNPQLTPDALAAALIRTAKDLGPKGRDSEFGAGLVDAYEAVLSQAPPVAQGSTTERRP